MAAAGVDGLSVTPKSAVDPNTNNNSIDVNTDAVSAVFAPQAIAFDVRRAYRLEPERDASLRAWELNATMVYAYGLGERPTWGVKITADATAP